MTARKTLLLLSVAELMGMSLWFTASAVSGELRAEWDLSAPQTAWLTSIVQVGFVVGTALAAILNLADVVSSKVYVATAAVTAAVANASLALVPGYGLALLCRFVTGACLAGVYPPAMKMIATWYKSGRGLAIGTMVGALTLGKSTPYIVKALSLEDWRPVVLIASGGATLGGLLVATLYRDGPHVFERRPFSWDLVSTVLKHRPTMLATGGYLGHMWELYAMWAWIPAFLAASTQAWAAQSGQTTSSTTLTVLAFAAIGVGAMGCVWGGWAADRVGRPRVVNIAMGLSGACCVLVGVVFGMSPWIVVPVVLVWGFFVVADSAQFSAIVTEVAPSHAVGTALTLQTSLGFLLTLATLQGVAWISEGFGWRWAFAILVLGPLAGISSIVALTRSTQRAKDDAGEVE